LWKQVGGFGRRDFFGQSSHKLGQGLQIQEPRINAIEGVFAKPIFVNGGNNGDLKKQRVEIADGRGGGIAEDGGNGEEQSDKSWDSKRKPEQHDQETARNVHWESAA